mgnify:FL=1
MLSVSVVINHFFSFFFDFKYKNLKVDMVENTSIKNDNIKKKRV